MDVQYDGVIVESTANVRLDDGDCFSIHVPLSSYSEQEGSGGTMEPWLVPTKENIGGAILVEDEGPSSSSLVGSWSLLQRSYDNDNGDAVLSSVMLREEDKGFRSMAIKATFETTVFSCSCLARSSRGTLQMGVVTVDGYLHLIVIPYGEHSSGHAVVSSISVMDTVDGEFGKPTSLAMLQDSVCLGGASGGIACFSINGDTFNNSVSYLGLKSGILGNVASYLGFSQRQHQNASSIECMSVVNMSWNSSTSKSILFCLHNDAGLCIWDVEQRVLLHSVTLLHEDHYIPSCLDYSQDFLTDGGIFLIASFEDAEKKCSLVSLFEITVDNRNDILSVHVENGPQLPEVDGRVTSASLEFVDANSFYMWFITRNHLTQKCKSECVLFQGDSRGNHKSSQYAVVSLESRLESLVASSEQGFEVLKIYFSEIQMALQECEEQHHLGNYIVDTVFLPWSFSHVAMKKTFSTLEIPNECIVDLSEGESSRCLQYSVEMWMKTAASPLESFAKCAMFLETYIAELGDACAPVYVKVLQDQPLESNKTVVLMRNDGKISILSRASPVESIKYNGVDLLSSFQNSMEEFLNPAAIAMARYAVCHGVNLKQKLLPSIVKVLKGEARVNAVEFGKHSSLVRGLWRKFPSIVQSFDLIEIGNSLSSLLKAYEERTQWIKKADCAVNQVMISLSKSAMYGCSIAEIDLGFTLLALLEYNLACNHIPYMENFRNMILPPLVSYWACTAPILQGNGTNVLKAPDFLEKSAIEHVSKKMKMLEIRGRKTQAFDVCFCLNPNISMGDVRELQGIDSFISASTNRCIWNADPVADFMHALIRHKNIMNKEEIVGSLLILVESLDRVNDIDTRFFQAYMASKRAAQSLHHPDHIELEQKGLGLFLNLCDTVYVKDNAEALIRCFESMGRSIQEPMTEEKYIDGIANILDYLGCVSSTTRCGLFSARLQESLETKEGHENASRVRSRVYKVLEENNHIEEAYTVALSILDPQRKADCVRGLVEHICSHRDLETLCSLPMIQTNSDDSINVLDQIMQDLWERAIKESIDDSRTYSVLFDLYVTRGNFQSAAAALLLYCRRLAKESTQPHLHILLELQKRLTIVAGCLRVVDESDAWLEDASELNISVRKTFSGSTTVSKEYTSPQIVTIHEIEKESILVKALIQIVSVVPDYSIHSTPQDVLYQLLELQLHSEAWDLVHALFSSSECQKGKEIIVSNLGKKCVITDAPRDWELLKSLIRREEASLAAADRLRLTAADAILETNDAVGIPPWILEPYLCKYDNLTSSSTPENHKSDTTGMLRVLLKHGRVELAGNLALELLSPLVTRIPSVAFSSVGSVCISPDIIDRVIHSLSSDQSESMALVLKRLSKARQVLEQSSSSQSNVLETLFSES